MIGRLRITLVILLASTASAWAGGAQLYEVGAPTQGVANNGQAAAARDASTALLNPAGMARLERSQLMVAGQLLLGDIEFDRDASTTFDGGNGGNQAIITPIPTAFYVYDLMDDVKLGVSLASLVGGGLDPKNDWAGRFVTQEVGLTALILNPVVSLKLVEWASLGAGFVVQYSRLEDRIGFANPAPGAAEGQLRIDDDDFGFGFNLGLLVEPRPGTRIGLAYRSEIDQDFGDDTDFDNILGRDGTRDLNTEFDTPQTLILSAYQQVTDEFAVLADLGWTDWSIFQFTTITGSEGRGVSIPRDWRDTWRIGIGFEYRIADPWLLQCGFSYDSSPVKSSGKNFPDFPSDRQFRYAAGVVHDLNEDMSVALNYEFLDAGNAAVDVELPTGRLSGEYDSNYLHFIALSLNWKL